MKTDFKDSKDFIFQMNFNAKKWFEHCQDLNAHINFHEFKLFQSSIYHHFSFLNSFMWELEEVIPR